MRANGATQAQIADVYSRLKTHQVKEASDLQAFYRKFPPAADIDDIEIGDDVNESFVRFNDRRFIVFRGRVRLETVIKAGMNR
jgi:hypothetical protein